MAISEEALTAVNMKVSLLSDGISYWDGGGAFGLVPRVRWMKLLPPDEFNRVPQDLRSVLIQIPARDGQRSSNILVDCGVGAKPNDVIASQYEVRRPNGTLLDDLERHALRPRDINIVIFTHLHGDHSGWATECIKKDAGCEYVPTFANARYYVQRQEYEDATHTNERTRNTYFAENFVPLMNQGILTLLDGEANIVPGVRVVPTPGHTAGHQSVIVTGAASPLLILGDLATYMIQFARLPWVTAYDVLPLQTIETKRYWQQWALETQAVLVSPHDTLAPSGILTKDNKGFLHVIPMAVGNS
jgi:glyoxylase-like metal-dependent hydrolase (beta-lactamase superfamily II)